MLVGTVLVYVAMVGAIMGAVLMLAVMIRDIRSLPPVSYRAWTIAHPEDSIGSGGGGVPVPACPSIEEPPQPSASLTAAARPRKWERSRVMGLR